MTNTKQTIDEFVALKTIAVVGVSREPNKFGNMIYRELKKRGKKVYAVNPAADMLEGDRCYAGLGALPEKVDGVVIVVPPARSLDVIRDAAKAQIGYVWLQQGSNSLEGEKLCEELGVKFVSGECIFMYSQPVESIHKFHRCLRRIFGGLPR